MEGIFVARIVDFVPEVLPLSQREREKKAVEHLLAHFLPDTFLTHSLEGAPILEGYGGAISISHSTDLFALYLSPTASRIGLDLETKFAKVLRIAPRFMDADELQALSAISSLSERERFATLLWCAKEATFKYFRTAHPDFRAYYHLLHPTTILPFTHEPLTQVLQLSYLHPSHIESLHITVEQHPLYTLAYVADSGLKETSSKQQNGGISVFLQP
ncbi:4'-phosphopantetheinyl transferase family protein [Porphyromonas circumdentaria]|uniref:4'-phosphopantetheinyl transferase family protein n=1 Tax=Porphyromonas circumdentaria TaxID=29524 RepID=UPI0026DCA833|nr:4'-phosphopantetheinyl transferase superfamily protein [Porphyromonas circumdentaria]MDO4722024.1 4'-phosphopantetheinyl transferase superfamily protein [Porphyromonas circumdentaria]